MHKRPKNWNATSKQEREEMLRDPNYPPRVVDCNTCCRPMTLSPSFTILDGPLETRWQPDTPHEIVYVKFEKKYYHADCMANRMK